MRDDIDQTVKIELLSQWKLEAEFRNKITTYQQIKGLFINDVINFGGYRDPPSPSSSFVTFLLHPPPSSRV